MLISFRRNILNWNAMIYKVTKKKRLCFHTSVSVSIHTRVPMLVDVCIYKWDMRVAPFTNLYHLNLAAGHKVHLSRHAFVIALLFRENKQQSAQKTSTEKTPPHPMRALHEIWWAEQESWASAQKEKEEVGDVWLNAPVSLCARHVFVCISAFGCVWRCVRNRPRAVPHRPVPKSCVQAVSNKLLNLIKRSGIILPSPQGTRTAAIMNTFSLIIMLWLQSLPQEKLLPFWKSSMRQGDTCINGQVMRL